MNARLPVLAAGGCALLAGLYGALLLLGTAVPAPPVPLEAVHGPLMVLGFAGTLIALERAVALGARWALLAPGCSGLGGLTLLVTGPSLAGKVLLMTASVVLLGVYRALWRRQPGVALLDGRAERWFLAALAALTAGAAAATVRPAGGTQLFGAGLLSVVAWLVVYDVARRTVRATGLPRYIAVGLLAGYAWLGLAGLLWAGGGATGGGPRYDATVHAVFLGFVMSMIFVHAPVILPAVLRVPLPYHPVLYAPLALLHASLLLRVVLGDAFGIEAVWRWAGVANVVAVLAFAACVALSRRTPRRAPVARAVLS